MADKIKVEQTPIQRNFLDVAVELTQLYYESYTPGSIKEIQDNFLKFYVVAETAKNISIKDLVEYLPDELKQIINERYTR